MIYLYFRRSWVYHIRPSTKELGLDEEDSLSQYDKLKFEPPLEEIISKGKYTWKPKK